MVEIDRLELIGDKPAFLPDAPYIWTYGSSAQAVSPDTETKLILDLVYAQSPEMVGALDAGNYRITPPYQGMWWCMVTVRWNTDLSNNVFHRCSFWRNGSVVLRGVLETTGKSGGCHMCMGLVPFDGDDDYIEVMLLHNDDLSGTTPDTIAGRTHTRFQMFYMGSKKDNLNP